VSCHYLSETKCYTQKNVAVCVRARRLVFVMINIIHFFVKFVGMFGVMLQEESDDF